MRTVDIRDVLITAEPSRSAKGTRHVAAIVGRTLGEVSTEELIQAATVAKPDLDRLADAPLVRLQEVFVESEEE